jgi:mono/diheme cytochrome c family protein
MYDQPRLEPFEASSFFPRGLSARPEIPGTVPRGSLELEALDPRSSVGFPIAIDAQALERGRSRYEIFCSPCHGLAGYGDGIIVRRGFPAPPSFHSDRLRAKPPSHYVEVIANGYGRMFDYAARVRPRDRWAVAAYIQALQLSQAASIEDAPAEERARLSTR